MLTSSAKSSKLTGVSKSRNVEIPLNISWETDCQALVEVWCRLVQFGGMASWD